MPEMRLHIVVSAMVLEHLFLIITSLPASYKVNTVLLIWSPDVDLRVEYAFCFGQKDN